MKQVVTVLRVSSPDPSGSRRDTGGFHLESSKKGQPKGFALEQVEVNDDRELAEMRRDPSVSAHAPGMPMALIEPLGNGDDFRSPEGNASWGVLAVGAHLSKFDGSDITVAVLDSGISGDHPAFEGLELVKEDFTGSGSTDDLNGHGTHCAGTIFGRDVNGYRIGVARGIRRAVIGKVIGGPENATNRLSDAIIWAADMGATVISLSLGIDFLKHRDRMMSEQGLPERPATSKALEDYRANVHFFEKLSELLLLRQSAVHLIAAAGNESLRTSQRPYIIQAVSPAAAGSIVAVGALRRNGKDLEVAPFSNRGVSVAAPGVDITSAWPGKTLRTISGTSMATPHVAGVAALWAQACLYNGRIDAKIFISRLLGSGLTSALPQDLDPSDVGTGLVRAPGAASADLSW